MAEYVERLLDEKEIKGERHYLVSWRGSLPPSWQGAKWIEEQCAELVKEFQALAIGSTALNLAIPPSSRNLSWDVVASLLGEAVSQGNWKPPKREMKGPEGHCKEVLCYRSLIAHGVHVDENDEAGKLPLLSMILVDAIDSYPKLDQGKELILVPQARVIQGCEYKTDYGICLAKATSRRTKRGSIKPREISPLIIFEIKKQVSQYLRNVDGKHLAQAIIEGYYVMRGSRQKLNTVIVALTDVANTHFFKLVLPSSEEKLLEVLWHHFFAFQEWIPRRQEEVVNFIEDLHGILTECLSGN